MVFLKKKKIPKKKYIFLPFFQCNFSVRMLWCFQNFFLIFLTPKKWKTGPQKLLIISRDPFFPQSSPQPTSQKWFSISWNLGTRHLFSYLWYLCLGWTVGEKGLGWLWATFEAWFFTFSGSKKKIWIFFWKHHSVHTEKLHWKKVKEKYFCLDFFF